MMIARKRRSSRQAGSSLMTGCTTSGKRFEEKEHA